VVFGTMPMLPTMDLKYTFQVQLNGTFVSEERHSSSAAAATSPFQRQAFIGLCTDRTKQQLLQARTHAATAVMSASPPRLLLEERLPDNSSTLLFSSSGRFYSYGMLSSLTVPPLVTGDSVAVLVSFRDDRVAVLRNGNVCALTPLCDKSTYPRHSTEALWPVVVLPGKSSATIEAYESDAQESSAEENSPKLFSPSAFSNGFHPTAPEISASEANAFDSGLRPEENPHATHPAASAAAADSAAAHTLVAQAGELHVQEVANGYGNASEHVNDDYADDDEFAQVAAEEEVIY